MSDASSPSILDAILYVRALFQEVSKLLRAADEPFADRGYQPASDVSSIYDSGQQLDAPDRWLPTDVFRLYRSDAHPRLRVMLTVHFYDRFALGNPAFKECVVACVAMRHRGDRWTDNKVNQATPRDSHWRAHLWHDARMDDGRILESDVATWPEEERSSYPYDYIVSVGVPLPKVTSVETLKTELLTKLLDRAEELVK